MNENDLINKLLSIPKEGEYELELESGFIIRVNYKDKIAMDIINYILSQNKDIRYQDMLDIINSITVWTNWLSITDKNIFCKEAIQQLKQLEE